MPEHYDRPFAVPNAPTLALPLGEKARMARALAELAEQREENGRPAPTIGEMIRTALAVHYAETGAPLTAEQRGWIADLVGAVHAAAIRPPCPCRACAEATR